METKQSDCGDRRTVWKLNLETKQIIAERSLQAAWHLRGDHLQELMLTKGGGDTTDKRPTQLRARVTT